MSAVSERHAKDSGRFVAAVADRPPLGLEIRDTVGPERRPMMSNAGQGPSGRLTTHVLDTMSGRPGAGLVVELFRLDGEARRLLNRVMTNDDGRAPEPLLAGSDLLRGTYELVFHVGIYFRGRGVALTEPAFLDQVPVRFGIADPMLHYHVPLLVSPYGYSTYRGS
jgi:5-hydroxyisourate hydrolase